MKGYCTFSSLGRYGRFANQIFQIAGTIGIARKNGLEPVFPTWRNIDHAERFGSSEDINVFEHFINPLPRFPAATYLENWQIKGIGWGYHDINLVPGNYDLTGHMQSLKYFDHCLEEVRHYMKMKGEGDVHDIVAVHWRKGDYDDKYHPVQPMSYYVKAIQHFPANSTFMLFSDDESFYMKLSSALVEAGNSNVQMIQLKEDYIRSFTVMKKCRHFIIANSSYSAAAAILSESYDKVVVAPKNWFGQAYAGITASDIYCQDWILL